MSLAIKILMKVINLVDISLAACQLFSPSLLQSLTSKALQRLIGECFKPFTMALQLLALSAHC